MAKSTRWQKNAVVVAILALLGLSATQALALSLGRLTVLSALGEPLRAEIDVPDINAEEAASLKTSVAAPDAFVAAGLDYNPAMSGLQATLQRRADGRAFIRLSSERSINDPYIDMILETSWSSGRIVRDYTMLFDPPVLRQAPMATTLAQTAAVALPIPTTQSAAVAAIEPLRTAPTAKPAASNGKPATQVPLKIATAATKAPSTPTATPSEQSGKQVLVKTGDTASKIADNTKSTGVSLDQMLVALLRSNPDAFVKGNINRIRAGTVMNVPSTELAQSVPTAEATQIVVAHSKDFNEFRRNLAGNAPAAAVEAVNRKASGAINTKVEEKKATAATPDKLTLSKGALKAPLDEAKIAKERADKDNQARAEELAKNISDLKKLGAATTAAPLPAPAVPASSPKVDIPLVAAAPVVMPAVTASAPQPPVSVAPAPKKAMPAPVTAPVVEPETSFLDELLSDPMVPAAGTGLIALLAGLALWRSNQRKKNAAQVDSAFLESRLQPDSFFGASGGHRVDTTGESGATGSSMLYSPSQLDSADDVDPVAEADVYLAYGRDLQAEEILREALKTNPKRVAIHTKLLEIYAKRRDAVQFQASAVQAYKVTGGDSPEWLHICDMGLALDPTNPMYQPGGAPATASPQLASAENARNFGTTIALSVEPELPEPGASVDLDLDLDFSLDDEPVGTPTLTAQNLPEISLSMDGLSLDDTHAVPDLSFDTTSAMPVQAPAATTPAPINDSGMLEFDLGSLSLDLEPPAAAPATEAPWSAGEDPLETKLALAEEFVSIGDEDGARALIEEVVAEATGDMRAKAQRALANLS